MEELLGCGGCPLFPDDIDILRVGKNSTEMACPLTFSLAGRLSWKVPVSKEEAHYTGSRKEERSVTRNVE